jgi:hypothetical protein
VVLRDVQIVVPPTMPYKDGIAEEKYIAFALVTQDGLPLLTTKRAALSLVSTSFNSGFKLGHDDPQNPASFGYGIPPGTQGGQLPVLMARVGATISAPALNGMKYTMRDWHLNPISSGTITGGMLRVPADKPVFTIQLER